MLRAGTWNTGSSLKRKSSRSVLAVMHVVLGLEEVDGSVSFELLLEVDYHLESQNVNLHVLNARVGVVALLLHQSVVVVDIRPEVLTDELSHFGAGNAEGGYVEDGFVIET
jgi:hypothetical protein